MTSKDDGSAYPGPDGDVCLRPLLTSLPVLPPAAASSVSWFVYISPASVFLFMF